MKALLLWLSYLNLVSGNPARLKRESSDTNEPSDNTEFYCFTHNGDLFVNYTEEMQPQKLESIPNEFQSCCASFKVKDYDYFSEPKYYVGHSQNPGMGFYTEPDGYHKTDACYHYSGELHW